MAENKSSGISWPLILIVIVIIIFLTVGTSFLMVFLFTGNSGDGIAKGNEPKIEEVSKLGPTYSLGEFVVNLSGNRGLQIVRTEVFLEAENEEQLKEIQEREIQLRDAVITILRSKTREEVEGDLDPLKQEIVDKLNTFLAKGKIKTAFVNTFVTQ